MNRNVRLVVVIAFALLLALSGSMMVSTRVTAQDPSATPAVQPTDQGGQATPQVTMQATNQGNQGGSAGGNQGGDVVYLTLDELTGGADQYYGQRVSIEGMVHELVNVRTFVLRGEGDDLEGNAVLVVNMSGQQFPLTLTADERVQVAGIIQQFTRQQTTGIDMGDSGTGLNTGDNTGGNASGQPGGGQNSGAGGVATQVGAQMTATLDAGQPTIMPTPDAMSTPAVEGTTTTNLNLAESALWDYAGYTVLVLNSVDDINFMANVNDIGNDPERFYGREFTIAGTVGDVVSPQAFVLRAPDGSGDKELLVLNSANQEFNVATDQDVWVYGRVVQFDRLSIAQRYGLNLDENVFAEYQEYTVLLAESTSPR